MEVIIKSLFTTGLHSKLGFSEKRDVIFANQANTILILCSFLVLTIHLFLGFHIRMIVPAGVLMFFASAFFLQRYRQYVYAKLLIVGGAFASGFLATLFFGGSAKTQFYFFASFILGMVIFRERKQQYLLAAIHLIGFSFIHFQVNHATPLIAGHDYEVLAYFHIPIVFGCIFISINEFVMNYQRYEKRINKLMEATTKNSELIEVERSKFKMQSEILRSTNGQLMDEIQRNEKIQKELMDSNNSLGQFAYVASHDLKEPLRTIGSFSQLIRRKLEGKLEEDTREYLNFIIEGVSRMSNLLDDLLALSKLDQDFEMTTVDLNRCVELTKLNLRNALEKHNGTILSVDLPVIQANRSQINQLLQNLLSNGLKFNRAIPPIVEINCEEQSDDYLFSIKDNGIGIKEEYKEKIFSIFQRLHKKTDFEGTGIGLSICKKVVQNHGGKIWVESIPGVGTTFYFTIAKNNYSQMVPAQINTEDILSEN